MALTFTQAELDAIKKAYATGALTVKYEDRSVTYRSLSEMERIIARMEQDLAAQAGQTPIRHVRVDSPKGPR